MINLKKQYQRLKTVTVFLIIVLGIQNQAISQGKVAEVQADSLLIELSQLKSENTLLKNHIVQLQVAMPNLKTGNENSGYAVLVVGLIMVALLLIMMHLRSKFFGPNFTKILGITIILTFGVFLVVSNTSKDLAPMIGLIGTLAGYLFGRSDNDGN